MSLGSWKLEERAGVEAARTVMRWHSCAGTNEESSTWRGPRVHQRSHHRGPKGLSRGRSFSQPLTMAAGAPGQPQLLSFLLGNQTVDHGLSRCLTEDACT